MPKAITPLTDSQCKNLALPAKGINQLSDGHGLSLQADSKGGKYWRLRYYHPHTKKREEIRLGIYPDVSLKAARVKREELRALLEIRYRPEATPARAGNQTAQSGIEQL